jgi:hypothetical protein
VERVKPGCAGIAEFASFLSFIESTVRCICEVRASSRASLCNFGEVTE